MVVSDSAQISEALARHFFAASRRGPHNRWRWSGPETTKLLALQQQALVRPFIEEEVRSAIRGLNWEGAPGPDGLLVFFFRDSWATVGVEVMHAVKLFRRGELNMDRINWSYVVRIPKQQGAVDIGDFRLISLSNSI